MRKKQIKELKKELGSSEDGKTEFEDSWLFQNIPSTNVNATSLS